MLKYYYYFFYKSTDQHELLLGRLGMFKNHLLRLVKVSFDFDGESRRFANTFVRFQFK